MGAILKAMPLTESRRELRFPVPYRPVGLGAAVMQHVIDKEVLSHPVDAARIVVWVNLTLKENNATGRDFYFPAILDTGHNDFFAIRQEHFERWTSFEEGSSKRLKSIGMRKAYIRRGPDGAENGSGAAAAYQLRRGYQVPVYNYRVWIFGNRAGTDQVDTDRVTPLNIDGVTIYPPEVANAPTTPILGMKALQGNNLFLAVDGHRQRVGLAHKKFWHSTLMM